MFNVKYFILINLIGINFLKSNEIITTSLYNIDSISYEQLSRFDNVPFLEKKSSLPKTRKSRNIYFQWVGEAINDQKTKFYLTFFYLGFVSIEELKLSNLIKRPKIEELKSLISKLGRNYTSDFGVKMTLSDLKKFLKDIDKIDDYKFEKYEKSIQSIGESYILIKYKNVKSRKTMQEVYIGDVRLLPLSMEPFKEGLKRAFKEYPVSYSDL